MMQTTRYEPPQESATDVAGLFDKITKEMYEFDSLMSDGKATIYIGTAGDNEIVSKNGHVSEVHCKITKRDDGTYLLEDDGSLNGVYVNDIKLESVVIQPGMWLRLGSHEMFVLGKDEKVAISAKTQTSFLAKAAIVYGCDEKAAEQVHKSTSTIARARRRWWARRLENARGDTPVSAPAPVRP